MFKITEKELVVYPSGGSGPSFSVKTIHISCKSDTYLGPHHKQSGIVISFDNLHQNKSLTNRCTSFRSRDIFW